MPNLPNTGKSAEYEDLRGRILNMWSGFHGPLYTSTEIAAELNTTRNVVIGIVMRARANGDMRAVVRNPAKARKGRRVKQKPARNGEGVFVRPVPPVTVPPPPPPPRPDPTPMQSPAFCFSKNSKARTVLNIGYDECHYPLESVTKDGFRMYCARDARDTIRAHQKAYCREHYERMFYPRKEPSRNVSYEPIAGTDKMLLSYKRRK
jgi:hypothetical protein